MMPGMGGQKPPKELMSMLATLMLNSRLQQGGQKSRPPRPQMSMGQGRMSELANMQLGLNAPRSRGEGLPYGLRKRTTLPPGLAGRTSLPPGLM